MMKAPENNPNEWSGSMMSGGRKILMGLGILGMILGLLAGCGAAPADPSVDVSVAEALRLWQSKEAILIDVRTTLEYREGHIPGVANIPLDELERRMNEVPKDKKVVLICRTGNRSAEGTKLLRSKGFANVFNSTGGMSTWTGPVTK
jgi:hydroxyacylglutathione hydrolase